MLSLQKEIKLIPYFQASLKGAQEIPTRISQIWIFQTEKM